MSNSDPPINLPPINSNLPGIQPKLDQTKSQSNSYQEGGIQYPYSSHMYLMSDLE
jgi:hypothetical protein